MRGAADKLVTVSPAPDTLDASANTQISMLGVPAGELSAVRRTLYFASSGFG